MASREDMLIELGLSPTWRRRDVQPALSPATIAAIPASPTAREEAAAATHSARIPATPTTTSVADEQVRSERIAGLQWSEFAADVAGCTACGLCRTRKKTVPGVGDIGADWLFVGEAPGAEEDAKGEPFVGQAGRLLDSMLAALKLARGNNVYIANVLKCRPPNNRTPEPLEAEACRPYLERQIALLKPRIIVALGKSAASLLLHTDATIASLRGRLHDYGGVPLVVTYHPAYLLRSLNDKAKAWEDLLFARRTVAAEPGADSGAPLSVAPSVTQPVAQPVAHSVAHIIE
jgi:uracil-DNA glycosylase